MTCIYKVLTLARMEGVIPVPKKTTKSRKPMNAKIIQSGNSLALRVSSELAKMYGLSRGMEVSIEPEIHGFTVSRRDEENELDRLASLIDDENRHALEEWGAPKGREVW